MDIYCFTVLEAGSPRSWCRQACSFQGYKENQFHVSLSASGGLLAIFGAPGFANTSRQSPFPSSCSALLVSIFVPEFPVFIRMPDILDEECPCSGMTSSEPAVHAKINSIPTSCHFLGSWGLGLQHKNFGGHIQAIRLVLAWDSHSAPSLPTSCQWELRIYDTALHIISYHDPLWAGGH